MQFLVALGISFVGSLPLGVLNLTAVAIRIRQSVRALIAFSVAAALIEWLQVWVSLYLVNHLREQTGSWAWAEYGAVLLFWGIGIYYLRSPQKTKKAHQLPSGFSQGVFLSLLNPLAIPFWIFWGFSVVQWGHSLTHYTEQLLFTIGVALGTLLALLGFGLLGHVLKDRLPAFERYLNQLIGWTLISLGTYQLFRLVLPLLFY